MKTYYDDYWSKNPAWSPSGGTLTGLEKTLVFSVIEKGIKVLDYGCGDCQRYGKMLTAFGVDYVGFDVSEKAVNAAKSNGIAAGLLVDGFRTTLEDEACDVSFCFEVLEHLMEPDQAVQEIVRKLKTNGVAVFSVPNAAYWFQRLEFGLTGFWNPGGSPLTGRKAPWRDPHIRFFSPNLLKRILRENGFSNVQIYGDPFSLKNMPYLYRAKRLGKIADWVSWPLGWLGYCLPSLFTTRVFAVARKF